MVGCPARRGFAHGGQAVAPDLQIPRVFVAGLVKSKISELGENIVICRFTRYMVGQGVTDEPAAE
jgi:hypothetical protein